MDHRCNAHWHLNKYTGKCVPESNYGRDPQTCGETYCGYWFKCDPATLLCLKKSGEKAPPLAKCKDVYEVTNPMDMYWFGETADEAEVGFNGDSDEAEVGKDAEGPDTLCLPDWDAKETFRSTQAARCGANYKLNHYTGKCVPNSRYWIDPQTCSETKCGGFYKCDPATILCLHMDKFGVYGHIVEKAPQLKKCAEIYDPYGGQMWWGETANEASLGQTFDSDEQQVGVDAQGPNTMCLATEDVKDKFTHAMDYRCNAHWH